MNKFRLSLAATFLVISSVGLAGAATAKSGWIDGDTDEVRLPVERPVKRQGIGGGSSNVDQTGRPYQILGDPASDPSIQMPSSSRPSNWSSSGEDNSASERRGYQPADNGEEMSQQAPPGMMDKAGNPVDSLDDLDTRTVQVPKLTIREGGSAVITGGVTSANFRTARSMNRGTDESALRLMERAPYLAQPRTIAAQPSMFKGFLQKNYGGEVSALGKNTIVELKGQWDDCAHALRNFGLPFTRMSPPALAKADLSHTKVLIVNCGANFDADSLTVIRDFVARGGFLLTTDWALDSCLQRAFPGYVEWNGGYTDNSVVDAVVVDLDPELTRGIPKVGYWKLEDKSQTVQVIRKLEVQVLVRSRVLMQREPSQLGILALTFPYGDGQVLHLVGHFDNNSDRAFNNALADPAPIIGIGLRQAIAANFLMAAARDATSADAQPPAPPTARAGNGATRD